MPEPTTVWMVHLRRGEAVVEVEGEIDLTGDAMVFTGKEDGEPVSFAFTSVRRAKRLRGSPVMLLEWQIDDEPRKTAFYFSEPPPLAPPEPGQTTLPGDPFTTRPTGAFGAIRRYLEAATSEDEHPVPADRRDPAEGRDQGVGQRDHERRIAP